MLNCRHDPSITSSPRCEEEKQTRKWSKKEGRRSICLGAAAAQAKKKRGGEEVIWTPSIDCPLGFLEVSLNGNFILQAPCHMSSSKRSC